jgi:serine protease Do
MVWPAEAVRADAQNLRRTPVVDVFEDTRDAVVNIAATQVVEIQNRPSWFDHFFDWPGRTQPRRYERTHLGSGFILHRNGYVVTNAHVAARAAALRIIFSNGSEYEAEPVAVDEKHDLAVLKIQGNGTFPSLPLGRSDDLMIGETVIAIGNPLGYQHTVTTGIVSATDRTLNFRGDVVYDGLIQTDASINPGNSGGPLLNVLGELIGINTAIRGDAQNIGFAIPVNTLRKLLPEILSIERRKRLDVGLRLTWRGEPRVVEATGPAATAGIEPGDEVLSLNDNPIGSDVDFYIYLFDIEAGDRLSLGVRRDGSERTFTFRPARIPIPDGAQLLREKFGLTVRVLSESQARQLDVEGRLLITAVESGSPAARAGFVPGLIIFQLGRHFPSDLDDVGLLLEHVKAGDSVSFRVYQVDQSFIRALTATLPAR